jgi:uncharacterized protein YbdZ (MbtH family)
MAETPAGWVGAWDREALQQFVASPRREWQGLKDFTPEMLHHTKTAWKMGYDAAKLEQEEQEPVAWMYRGIGVVRFAEKLPSPGMHKTESVALYTTPPRREWVSLTDEEIKALLPGAVRVPPGWRETVAAVEAKLKEKNHG